ncbi:RHS repeat-associated core domain-containing protein [Micromonospora pattaloongensis]|uniref:RHS repeat-associated core domain-containing protein n=1 Tax=Micromonospora pattaloongensis TaxID=405436 RepID=A0A1H3LZN8_9ACTN|nr:RHS repeat-associated core domain-containing protein [Micromonospora pattaloongensis]SDY69880.1 RHS repeat-associated core domain-containing protein [Micromonospora pattaloongensis]
MRYWLAAGTAAAVFAGLLHGTPASAAQRYEAPRPQTDYVTPGTVVRPVKQPKPPAPAKAQFPAPAWPAARSVDVSLPTVEARLRTTAAPVAAPGTPVSVAASDSRLAGARLGVRVYDRTRSTAAGLKGVLVGIERKQVATAKQVEAPAQVTVDYSAFAGAFGADWAVRLRLVRVPECALTTPTAAACRPTPVPTGNDTQNHTLTTTVPLAASGATLLAAEAGTGGGSGDYGNTSLQASATWTAGSSTGEFNWNYPLRTPPSLGGPAPSLSLSYSSANVDGRTVASNNQPSWVGEGFEFWPGFIERRYKSCGDDMGNGANNTTKTGDLCWGRDNATLSMAGHAGELIQDGSNANRWHLRNDDGTYVRHVTGADNGDDNGEWWVVTTSDGTQYWFGGRAGSNAVWNVGVAGNHSGETCRKDKFADSFCKQAWRWNLDHVVDQHGNTMSYQYERETNKYAKAGSTDTLAEYDRGGYLTRISYGTRTGSTAKPPMVVDFEPGDRCLSNCGTVNADTWPDVPKDLECTGTPCLTGGPTFWSKKRLKSVTTKLYSGSGDTYNPVTTWTFTHSFPSPGDSTRAGLRLDKISQTGHTRVSTTVPDTTLTYTQMNNRVDPHFVPDHSPPMNWFRIVQILSESGGRTEVTYSPEDCVAGSRMPNPDALQNNTLRCYPVKWAPEGYQKPVWDYFHKYVVTDVHEVDTVTTGNPTTAYHYDYLGDPAWHYTDDDGLIKSDFKTWSVWRGYGAVKTTTGVGAGATAVETRYFRGMHGDKLPSGTRQVSLAAIDMNRDGDTSDAVDVPATPDEDAFAGMTREVVTLNGPSGVELSAQAFVPWQSAATATRNVNGSVVTARFTGVKETRTRLARDQGRAVRTTSSVTTFDAFGAPSEQEDRGDDAVTGDEKCTLIDYARNTDAADGDEWIFAPEKRKRAFATTCARAKQPGLTADQVIADVKTYYDDGGFDTPPTVGRVTMTEVMEKWENGAPVHMTASRVHYDANGRVDWSTDSRGNRTDTARLTNAGGQLVQEKQTNHLGWVTTSNIEPAFGAPLSDVDANGRVTSYEYDGLGRTTALWKPGRDKGVQSPHEKYEYKVYNDRPTVIVTSKLLPNGASYLTTYAYHDGLLRPRQTQAPRADALAGVLVTDTFYDSAGRVDKVYMPYVMPQTPGQGLLTPNEQGDVSRRVETTFDGGGRELTKRTYVRDPVSGVVSLFATESRSYGGDRVDVTPPTGGSATSSFTDAGGNVTALWTYHRPTPTPTVPGSYDAVAYEYTSKDQMKKVTDAGGNVWSMEYDVRGQKTKQVDPDVGAVTMTYNRYGDLESTKDARGTVLVYTYDSIGRKRELYQTSVAPANKRAEWMYDGLTNSRGQLTKTVRYEGGAAYSRSIVGFTADYQPSGVTYSIPATETGLQGDYTYWYTYASNGSPETTTLPDVDGSGGLTSEKLTTEYTALGQPVRLKTSLNGGTTYVSGTSYTGYGEMATTTLKYGAGNTVSIARTYAEGTRRLSRLLTSKQTSPTAVSDISYTHDQAGNIVRISEATSGDHQCFAYDYLRRLTEAWTPGDGNCGAARSVAALGGPAKYWTSWEFGTDGNRAKQTEQVTPTGVKTTKYDYAGGGHQLDTATVSDGTGTRTLDWSFQAGGFTASRPLGSGAARQSMTWDPEGHVATQQDASGTTSYVYDADGNRLLRRDPTGRTLYLPGQELRYTTSGGTKSCTRYYSHGDQLVATRTTAGVTWLSSDHQNTVAVSINASTQAVAIRRQDPYGNARTGSGTWPASMDKGFVGGTQDNTGLTHLGAREYDPVIGRFISPDPVIDFLNPLHLDSYAYGFHNPIRYADPGGKDPGVDYIWVGAETYTGVDGNYRYYLRVDYYVACRNRGAECVGYYRGAMVWAPIEAFFAGLLPFKLFASYSTWRKLINFIGPQVERKVQLTAKPPPAPYCLTRPIDPEPAKDPTKCDFVDMGCLFSGDWHKWWKGNKDWVQGAIMVGGLVTCAFTAGVGCAVAGYVGLGTALGGRALDFETQRREGTKSWTSGNDLMQLGLAVGIDVGGFFVPPLRNAKTGAFTWTGAGSQAAWTMYSAPGSWAPWHGGRPVSDPLQWNFLDAVPRPNS